MIRGSNLKMHYLSNFCCLCLTPNQNLKNILSEDADGLVVEQKLKLFLFELVSYKPYINKFVCNTCLENLNYVYKFKLMCLKNMTALNDYVQKLESQESIKNIKYLTDHGLPENRSESNEIHTQNNDYNKHETITTMQKNMLGDFNDNAPEEVFIKTEIETDDSNLSFTEDVPEKSQDVIVKREREDTVESFQDPYETFKEFNEEKYIDEEVTNTDNTPIRNMPKEGVLRDELLLKALVFLKRVHYLKQIYLKKEQVKYLICESDLRDMEVSTNSACASLPEQTKTRYNRTYEVFLKWCNARNIQQINENVMLIYFSERSEILKSPASLWSEYSMLKLTLSVQKNEDISKFKALKAFLKRKNDGYQPRKSKIFAKEEIERFIAEAPDEIYLMMKIVAILGVSGSCRTDELHRMKFNDIDVKDDIAIVKILETKNNKRRSFVVMNTDGAVNWLKLVQTYVQLRPKSAADERFFFRYERGRCLKQVAGKHTISKIPREIAKYLNLDNAGFYTGHSFKKTLCTFMPINHNVNIFKLNPNGR